MDLKSNHNVVSSSKYHVIRCPKSRRPVLVDGVDGRLKTIIRGVAEETRSEVIEPEVMPDHAHLLVEVDRRMFRMRLPERGACTPEKAGLFTTKTDSNTEHPPTSRIGSESPPAFRRGECQSVLVRGMTSATTCASAHRVPVPPGPARSRSAAGGPR